MNTYRILIVDDEALARQRLRQLLAAAPDFDVVGETDDARRVADLARALRPDVAFLDVRMPFLDGFDVLASIARQVRRVVFVTAHPEHAARAFDVDAADYLVKPVTQARFDAALQRVRRGLAEPGSERVVLGTRLGGAAVAVTDVTWVEADGAYVVVHAQGRRHVLRESLAQILGRLGAHRFVRVHRSAAVSREHVRALRRAGTRGLEVLLADGTRVSVSRRNAADVVRALRNESALDSVRDAACNEDAPLMA